MQRFGGWAVYSLTKRYKTKRLQKVEQRDQLCGKEVMLRDMTVRERQILGDETYLANFYSDTLMLINEGGLTLIKGTYCPLVLEMYRVINGSISEALILKNGVTTIRKARAEVHGHLDGWVVQFKDLTKALEVEDRQRKELVKEIVTKIFNARVGAAIKEYRAKRITRGGKKATVANSSTHRENLKHTCKSGSATARSKDSKRKRKRKT